MAHKKKLLEYMLAELLKANIYGLLMKFTWVAASHNHRYCTDIECGCVVCNQANTLMSDLYLLYSMLRFINFITTNYYRGGIPLTCNRVYTANNET